MFWKFNMITTSHVETLLSKENVTLKELMEEDDILQECKAQTKNLITFLTRPEIMDEMVTLITQEPPEDADEKIRYKYSNIACELLTSDVALINDTLVSDEALLNKLYSFIDTEKPLNPLLASFFSKTVGLLISRKTGPMFEFLKSKGDFISLLLNHLETSAVADLLLRPTTCIEDTESSTVIRKWLSDQNLIQRLLALIDPSQSEDCNGNAAQSLCDIVKCSREKISLLQEKAEPDPLLEAIESTETISELLDHMFNSEKKESVLVNGILVILSLLEFKKQGPAGQPNYMTQNSTQSQIFSAEGAQHCFTSLFFRNDAPDQMTPLDAERLAVGVNRVLAAVTPRLADFTHLLVEPPVKPAVATTVGTLDIPLGWTRLEVAHLLGALLNTNTHAVNVQMANLGTVPILFELFFQYTWNNFLHTQVEQAIATILHNSPTVDEQGNKVHPLLDQLLSECKIVQRLLDVWQENEQEQSQPGKHRRGYMGHLVKICNHLETNMNNGNNSDLLASKMKELPEEYIQRWEKFVSETLADINKKNVSPLVSGVPFPSNAEDEESLDYRDLPFPQETALQQAFSDYQMQQMTSNFVDQFGFHDGEFVESDENMAGHLDRLTRVNFQFASEENMRTQEMFEQTCRERIDTLDDSDEDVWEDKEITFATTEEARRRSSEENSSDSDDEGHKPVSSTPLPTAEEVKMEVDENESLCLARLPYVDMDTGNPWGTASRTTSNDQEWADFSSFNAFKGSEAISSAPPMETKENSSENAPVKSEIIVHQGSGTVPDNNQTNKPLSRSLAVQQRQLVRGRMSDTAHRLAGTLLTAQKTEGSKLGEIPPVQELQENFVYMSSQGVLNAPEEQGEMSSDSRSKEAETWSPPNITCVQNGPV